MAATKTSNPTTEAATTRSTRLSATITLLIRFALVVAAIIAVLTGQWSVLFASLGTLVLTFVPQVVATTVRIRIPLQFELIIVLFMYAAIFLGEAENYYYKFWWWDIGLHTFSAFSFGFAGFLILYTLFARQKLQASPFLISIFSFTFAVAIGAVWEIFEFTMDSLFGTNMQKSGLPDTMGDLIVDAIGAAVASGIGYVYLKYDVPDPFDALIGWFKQANPRFRSLSDSQASATKKRP